MLARALCPNPTRRYVRLRRLEHRPESLKALGDRAIDILAAEGLRRRAEHSDRVGLGRARALIAFHIGGQNGIGDALAALDARHHLVRRRHLRNPFRGNESPGLDALCASGRQTLDEFDLRLDADDLLLVLEAVARPDLVDPDVVGHVVID